jgi:hypothetical protein
LYYLRQLRTARRSEDIEALKRHDLCPLDKRKMGGEVNGKMLGLQGSRGDCVFRLRSTGLHVTFNYDFRRNDTRYEGLLRQLHRKEDAGLGSPA